MSENNTIGLPEDILKKMEEYDKFLQKGKDQEAVANIKNEYLSDEKKKALWDNGFGEKLEKNPHKVNDKEWIGDQLSVAMDRIQLKLDAAKMQEAFKHTEEEIMPPATPGNAMPNSDASNQEFDVASKDIFTNEDFLKKIPVGHRLMLEINKPSKVPSYKQ